MTRSTRRPQAQRKRQQRWLDKQRAQGLVRVEVRVPAPRADLIRRAAAALRAGGDVHIAPGAQHHMEDPMSQIDSPWTVTGLKDAIAATDLVEPGEFTLEVVPGAEPVLMVKLPELGDLDLFVSISGEQILTSVLLWPRDSQAEPEAFEAMMLRNHKKYLPLSALGITTVDGREWYEIWGAMSARSVLPSILTEFRTIAQNAVELGRDLGPAASAA